jgi:hypothetical protein
MRSIYITYRDIGIYVISILIYIYTVYIYIYCHMYIIYVYRIILEYVILNVLDTILNYCMLYVKGCKFHQDSSPPLCRMHVLQWP